MKIVSFEDIQKLHIPCQSCYEWVAEMIAGKKDVLLPAKISMKPSEYVFCNVMPSIIPNDTYGHIGGVKIVTRYPDRLPSLDSKLLLFNAESGEFLALMDANWITAMRAGAVAAHSISLLGKTDFKTMAFMGLGNTARATLLVLADVQPGREYEVKLLKYKGQENLFRERFSQYPNIHFTVVEDAIDLVRDSDIIVSAATYLEHDICPDEHFKEGVLVVPVHTRGFTNCDLFFEKVYADDYGHVNHFKNFEKFRSFAEVYDVVTGKSEGRKNDKERILVYNIGVSMHDINFAAHIYQMAMNKENLLDISLHEPNEKFWI